MEIIHVPYESIDKKKWDHCIARSKHSSLYGSSLYLDHLAGKWDALIAGDYEIIMPLIFRKKAGIKYLYQPPFLPTTGIWSAKNISSDTVKRFTDKAFSLFKFADLSIAWPNRIKSTDKKTKSSLRNNFVIDLYRDYKNIYESYDPSFSKSLRRLQKLDLVYSSSENIKEAIAIFKKIYGDKTGLKKSELDRFTAVAVELQKQENTIIRKVTDKEGNLFAIVLLLRYKDRLYNMISCITPEGKKAEANYFMYDRILEEFAQTVDVLDLEGSDIKGVAYFYEKMATANEENQFIRYNNLPALLRMIKK